MSSKPMLPLPVLPMRAEIAIHATKQQRIEESFLLSPVMPPSVKSEPLNEDIDANFCYEHDIKQIPEASVLIPKLKKIRELEF